MEHGVDVQCPFEGPEKLLEIWFAPSAACILAASPGEHARVGLRKIPRETWEEMLEIVQCKVLSVIEGNEMDAYLLSESSFFVSPHRLILKTCGTTLNLLGLPRILEIARTQASFSAVYRCFYSRKSFMFPERQLSPHREWKDEVRFLDNIFPDGSAYSVGEVNGDHWLLYITSAGDANQTAPNSTVRSAAPALCVDAEDDAEAAQVELPMQDFTIEILMSKLAPEAREPFFNHTGSGSPSDDGISLSDVIGISQIFPPELTTLDAYLFSPCGYSSNALLEWGNSCYRNTENKRGEGYYTIHVTPEEGWSYASFECNVPLPIHPDVSSNTHDIPDLQTLVRRVVGIFKPERLSLTLFISSKDKDVVEDEEGEKAVDAAQMAFKAALTKALPTGSGITGENGHGGRLYKRTDKINYEFRGYDLAFASFELQVCTPHTYVVENYPQ